MTTNRTHRHKPIANIFPNYHFKVRSQSSPSKPTPSHPKTIYQTSPNPSRHPNQTQQPKPHTLIPSSLPSAAATTATTALFPLHPAQPPPSLLFLPSVPIPSIVPARTPVDVDPHLQVHDLLAAQGAEAEVLSLVAAAGVDGIRWGGSFSLGGGLGGWVCVVSGWTDGASTCGVFGGGIVWATPGVDENRE
jgi:hypothetical protein